VRNGIARSAVDIVIGHPPFESEDVGEARRTACDELIHLSHLP
jgi:hypothetical protein